MHKDTKSLITFFIGLVVAAVIAFYVARSIPDWWHHETSLGAVEQSIDAQAHRDVEAGLWSAVVTYLGIAFTVGSVITFFIVLLTILKLDKERTATALHQQSAEKFP